MLAQPANRDIANKGARVLSVLDIFIFLDIA
jgi:hypothetical protein